MLKSPKNYFNREEQLWNKVNESWGEGFKGLSTVRGAEGDNKKCRYCGGDCEQVGEWVKQKKLHNKQMFFGAEFALHVCCDCYMKQNVYK
ncbi:hypothetical protein QUG02_11140 [Bacillus hominis]|uniref:HNH endonuclease n=1 Tax=Bacillus hominis TaxID=2817478 RepID=A0ABT7R6W5_9BACI|nr:hypothetical protein [Bacillus hominis]MDM5193531.1 hypothetical protein [Bacillus hominis]MDM5433255.1 hypothetical protein [Bacillus hominis]MDM5438676.1 hypothetical protein [Bacillus hominis]